MTVKIGWSLDEAKPFPHLVSLFSYLKTRAGTARYIVLGYMKVGVGALERLREQENVLDARVVGVLRFRKDVPVDLFEVTVSRLRVSGAVLAPQHLRDAVARVRRADR